MVVLGIETSCDETGVGIVRDGRELLANEVATSMDLHAETGGIVPEVAARAQMEYMIPVLESAIKTAGVSWGDIDAIAVTQGAGLGGSLLVGMQTAKSLAITKDKPLYAVNHVEGHIYANFLTKTNLAGYALPANAPQFPMLGVIVSGGHSQLVLWHDHFDYDLLGQTYDDAIGEAFDKVAKILGLPYPGGPSIAKAAQNGDTEKYKLPKAKMSEKYAFSFSGLKTAVLRAVQEDCGKSFDFPSFELAELLSEAQVADFAASFQKVAIETIVDKVERAYNQFNPRSIVIGGGVASSDELRSQLAVRLPIAIDYTDPKLCTDNGAMIATLGSFHISHKRPQADPFRLDIKPNLSM